MMKFLSKYKWYFGAGAALVILGLATYVTLGRASSSDSVEIEGETAVAFIGDLAESATASGKVSAAREAALSLVSAGRVDAVPVSVGDAVVAGDVLVELDTEALERSVASAEYDLAIAEAQLDNLTAEPTSEERAAAEAAVTSARAKLDDLLEGPTAEEIAASEASVNAAQANVWSASGSLSATQEVSAADIAAAQKELDAALDEQESAHNIWVILADCEVNDQGSHTCTPKEDSERMESVTEQVRAANAQVALKQAQLDELLSPDANQVASSQAGVGSASAQLAAARARHEALLAGPSAAEIAAAEAELASAEAALDKLIAGPSRTDLMISETRVAQAQLALQEARNALADATLTAPFDGTITRVLTAPGERASGLVVEMIADDALEVILNVDEVDIGKMAVGQPAVLTMEPWPDSELQSEITAIAPSASEAGTGAVSYDVHLSLPTSELPILVGMTANAELVTANRENILLVPNAAVDADRRSQTYTVNVVSVDADGNRQVNPVEVTIGLKDGQNTQITAGLQEGDEVLLRELTAPVIDFNGPPGR